MIIHYLSEQFRKRQKAHNAISTGFAGFLVEHTGNKVAFYANLHKSPKSFIYKRFTDFIMPQVFTNFQIYSSICSTICGTKAVSSAIKIVKVLLGKRNFSLIKVGISISINIQSHSNTVVPQNISGSLHVKFGLSQPRCK